MKWLMRKSINRLGTAYWIINKTPKESFHIWLYVVCPHWVKAVYLCFSLTPALSPCTPLGLQIKEGLSRTKQTVWQSSGHLRRTMLGFSKTGWERLFGYERDEKGPGAVTRASSPTFRSFCALVFDLWFKKAAETSLTSLWQQQRPCKWHLRPHPDPVLPEMVR